MNLKRLKNYLVITLMALAPNVASAVTSASSISTKKQTLFSSASHMATPYRIPAIATLKNGTILTIADHRPSGYDVGANSNNGKVDIYARIGSIDPNGNYTWTANNDIVNYTGSDKIQIANGDSSYGYGDAAVVVDSESGEVLLLCVGATKGHKYGANNSAEGYDCVRFTGSADGKTWTMDNTKLTSKVKSAVNTSITEFFFASGRLLQSTKIKVGTHYRIYGAILAYQSGDKNFVVYSDDFGKNWTRLGSSTSCCQGGNEAKLVELDNGDLILSSRTGGGRYYNVFTYSDKTNWASGSWEYTGKPSSSWFSDPEVKAELSDGSSCNGEFILYKGVTRKSDNAKVDILLQSLPTGSNRSKVSVYYQEINSSSTPTAKTIAKNWTKGIEVDDAESAYSTMTILPNGEIGFLYEDEYFTSNSSDNKKDGCAPGGTSNIVYVPLKVSEITGGAYTYVADVAETIVATPVITPNGGEIEAGTTISISCATEGATIYYSTNGAEPTTVYSAPFALNNVATVKAVAKKEGWNDSEIAAASFTIKQEVVEPEEPTQPSTPAVAKFRIKNVQKDGKVFYFTYSATDGIGLTADVEQAAQYTRKTVNEANGVYAFQVEDGSYLIWSGKGEDYPGYYDGKGYVAESEYDAAKCDLTVAPMVAGGNVESFEGTYYTIMGEREGRKSWGKAKIEDVYFVIKNDMTFSAGMDPYFNDTFSSAFLIEEVVEEPEPAVAAPVFSLPSGTYEEGTEITITCPTEGARIFVTDDGTTPTIESIEVPNGFSFELGGSMTINAIAVVDENYSEVVTLEYLIQEKQEEPIVETVATPTIIPYGGEIDSETAIRIICNTEGATIHYTTDGTEPTEESSVYDDSFTLDGDATVKAIAVKEGWNNSAVVSVNFTVKVVEPELHSWAVNVVGGKMNGRTRYMAPFSAPCNIELPNNVKAYYVKNYTSNNTTLTRIWSSIIPAYQGVILEASAEGEITITAAEEWATPARMSNNKLVDTADGPVVLESDAYVFEKNSSTGSMTFYKKTAGTTIPQNSCYLVKSGSLFPSILSIDFDEDSEFSGINDVNAEDAEVEYYNLQGVKVENPEKGIYIMKQGGKTSKVVL